MNPMDRIRELLGNVTNLSDQELSELRDLVMQQIDDVNPDGEGAGDDDSAGPDAEDEATLALMGELADAVSAVNAEVTTRNNRIKSKRAFAAAKSGGIAELSDGSEGAESDGEAGGEDAEGAEEGDGAEGEGAEGTEGDGGDGVTAGGGVLPPQRNRIKVPEGNRPKVIRPAQTVVASADIPGVPMGTEFSEPLDLAHAMVRRIETVKKMSPSGDGEQVVVASVQLKGMPDDRHLESGEAESNYNKVMDVIRPKAITAAGGSCAPVDTRYDLFGGGVTDRPVQSALASFTADRGGIRFVTPPTLGDLEGSVGIWTLQNDIDAAQPDDPGATPPFVSPTKPVLRVNCGPEVVVHTQAVTVGLVFGNMGARAYPELVARQTDLAMVAHARVAEQQLLAQIGALSLQVTTPAQTVGAFRHILVQVDKAAASYRNRYRTGSLPMRVIFPTWFKDLLRADIVLQLPGDGAELYAIADAMINSWFAARNINPVWALDGEAGQDYAAQANGAVIQEFPTQVIWYMYVEGTFLFLDGGTLDLGIVRDSTLNAKNDYQTFVETFEAVAKVGHESLRVTSAVSPTGATSAAVAVVAGDV